jgi:ankyrin repeat protein
LTTGRQRLSSWRSSPGVDRYFASCCGSPIYKRDASRPELLGLRLGTLDVDPGRKAERHFMIDSKAPWLDVHDGLPREGAGPPFGERDRPETLVPYERDVDAVIAAIHAGDARAVDDAIAADLRVASARDRSGVSLVCVAVYAGQDAIARRLAAGRDDLDVFEASVLGDAPRVRAIVAKHPTDADAFSPDGFHPLGYACFFGRREVFDVLLDAHADVAAPSRNAMRVRPLHSAAAHSDPELALYLTKRLLAAGASPNVAQQHGFTPLHEAALRGHRALVEVLLQHGADAGALDADGRTPVDLARGRGDVAIMDLLVASP